MIIQAMTGMIASETKTVDDVPSWVWSSPLIDTASGVAMAGSVSAALFARERTGVGQKIETTLLGQALNLMGARFLHVEKLDRETREKTLKTIEEQREAGASYDELVALSPGSRRREHHGNIYYRVYMTADGPIGVGCLSQPLRLRLLDTLGLTDEGLSPDWDPTKPESQEYSRNLERQAEELFRGKSSGEWLRILEERNIPAGPVRFIEEMFDDPQVVANGLVDEFVHSQEGAVRMVGHYATFSGTQLPHAPPSPALGEHTSEILGWLGYTPEQVDRLKEDKTVG
jgi:formyl-CoA transferase